jgi:hypothetical protein
VLANGVMLAVLDDQRNIIFAVVFAVATILKKEFSQAEGVCKAGFSISSLRC